MRGWEVNDNDLKEARKSTSRERKLAHWIFMKVAIVQRKRRRLCKWWDIYIYNSEECAEAKIKWNAKRDTVSKILRWHGWRGFQRKEWKSGKLARLQFSIISNWLSLKGDSAALSWQLMATTTTNSRKCKERKSIFATLLSYSKLIRVVGWRWCLPEELGNEISSTINWETSNNTAQSRWESKEEKEV